MEQSNASTQLSQLKKLSQQTNAGFKIIGNEDVFTVKAVSRQWLYIGFIGIPFLYFTYITIRNFNTTFLFGALFLLICLAVVLRNTQGYDLTVNKNTKRLTFKRSDFYGQLFVPTIEKHFVDFEKIYFEAVKVNSSAGTQHMNQVKMKFKDEDIKFILLPAGQLYNIDQSGFTECLDSLIREV